MMKPLLVATTNPGKLKEIQLVYADAEIELKSLKDFPGVAPAEETGETFEENAVIKAKYYFGETSLPTIADDGGLEVEALGGLPGVKSHRFLGYEASEKELAAAIIERLKGLPQGETRGARLGGYMAFYDGTRLFTTSNFVEGWIAEELPPEIEPGFPYRSILVLKEFGKLYKDLTAEENMQINHRRYNLHALKPEILERLKEK